MKKGEIDAISQSRPGDLALESDGSIVPVVDTRTAKGMKEVYGGAYAAGCIYAPIDLVEEEPEHGAGGGQRDGARAALASRRRRPTRSSTPCRGVLRRQRALYKVALREEPGSVHATTARSSLDGRRRTSTRDLKYVRAAGAGGDRSTSRRRSTRRSQQKAAEEVQVMP